MMNSNSCVVGLNQRVLGQSTSACLSPVSAARVTASTRRRISVLTNTRTYSIQTRITLHHVRGNNRVLLVVTAAARNDKGKKLDASSVSLSSSTLQRPLGEGSFGQVFEGRLMGDEKRVVLKRVKANVYGAQQVQEMEHVLNVYASKTCRSTSVAPFLGYLEVSEEEAVGKLTPGLWLVWEYEGDKTLAYYLKRRDCISLLKDDLGLANEEDVVPTVMRQLFECLNDLHGAGLVHRDVKPANMVFSEKEKRFKIIDLGAAADLRTGTNYSPQETMLDPCYCAPEEYVLPTDGPDMAKQGAMAFVMSPIVWSQHRPECFDSYSAGVVMLQLSLPFLRSASALRNWKQTMIRLKHDIKEWRERSRLSSRQTVLLDANDGAGWDLIEGLLRPRDIESDGRGGVVFVPSQSGGAPRLTPTEALKHPFLKKTKMDSSTAVARKKKGWQWVQSRVFDLEARIAQQASETETQTTIVKKLEADVAKGKAKTEDLEIERSRLEAMQSTLQASMSEMGSLFESAKGFLFSGGSAGKKVVPEEEIAEESVTASADVVREEETTSETRDVNKFLADAASSAIYSSLKFTGRALIAVADMASSAEESLGEAQAKREAVRKEKAIMEELLGRLQISATSSWEDVRGEILNILDDSILSESQMKRTFNMYVSGIAREERIRLKQAKLDYSTLLRDAALRSTISYGDFSTMFGTDPRFVSLDDENKRMLFDAHIESLKKREATFALARDVLDIDQEVPVSGSMSESSGGSEALDRLREEQMRMKSEYEVMEKKLKDMEALLKKTNLLAVEKNPEKGETTFRFNPEKIPTTTNKKQKQKKKSS